MISLYIKNLFRDSESSPLFFDQSIVMLFTDDTKDQLGSAVFGADR